MRVQPLLSTSVSLVVTVMALVFAVVEEVIPGAWSFETGVSSSWGCRRAHRTCSEKNPCLNTKSRRAALSEVAEGIASIGAAVAAFRIGAAVAVIGQPRMPRWEQSVGSRVMRVGNSGARVRLFYPTDDSVATTTTKTTSMAPYCTDGRSTSDGMAGLVGFRQLGLSFLLAHLAEGSSGCVLDAPLPSSSSSRYDNSIPLLVYSHGYGGNMDMATYFLATIASKGVAVAALEHTDGTASSTVMADGTTLVFSPDASAAGRRASLQQRADEMVDAVTTLSKELFPGADVYLGGHSYGGPSALLAAQQMMKSDNNNNNNNINIKKDNRGVVSGLVLHDPALGMGYGLLSEQGSTTLCCVSYVSDEYNRAGVRCGDFTFHVRGAFHGNFVDAPLWAPSWVMRPLSLLIPAAGPADPVQVHRELAESALAFMKATSTGEASLSVSDDRKRKGGEEMVTKIVGSSTLFEEVS